MNNQNPLFQYCLRLADNSMILSHRLSQTCASAPFLEEDVALTNIALDLLGQASAFYKYAVEIEDKGRTEDDLAYHRNERDYLNFQLVEYPNTDFAYIIVRQFLADAFYYHLYQQLSKSKDEKLASIAAKSLKEVTYHLRHSGQWMIRLGKGTEESKQRVQVAVNDLWTYTQELFEADNIDEILLGDGIAADLNLVKKSWEEVVSELFKKANIKPPECRYFVTGSKQGIHTESFGHMLSDMQYLQRAYPDAKW
ncbi:MAG TPA: phenylacetate-CoA oxygenase subunit PaaI [Flavobacteriales bacterium]|nr:phenylacetate-CoA oxygenase subunit PaaI [Flavobacteriales bacterium]